MKKAIFFDAILLCNRCTDTLNANGYVVLNTKQIEQQTIPSLTSTIYDKINKRTEEKNNMCNNYMEGIQSVVDAQFQYLLRVFFSVY